MAEHIGREILTVLGRGPERAAVLEPSGRRVSNRVLARWIRALARHLAKLGLEVGDRVALQILPGPELAAATTAVILAGGTAVLAEPGLGEEVYLARMAAARVRMTLEARLVAGLRSSRMARQVLARRDIDLPPEIPDALRVTVSSRMLERLPDPGADWLGPEVGPELAAALVFTGGTTAAPKGVLHTHRSLTSFLGNIDGLISELGVERFLADTPAQVLYALRLGKEAWVVRGRGPRRARRVWDLIRSGRVDTYFGSPYLWKLMLSGSTEPLPGSLRNILLGSAPVTPAFLRELTARAAPSTRILCLYGLTEAGPVTAATAGEKLAWDRGGDLVGRALPGMSLEIDGDEPGEVLVRGPSLYAGYLDQSPRSGDQPLRTGDLGFLHQTPDGPVLALAGRAKDMIIRGGVNIYPGTLEPGLRALEDRGERLLRDAVLVGLWNPRTQDEEVVLAAEALAPAPNSSRILALARAFCGPDAGPDHLILLEELPTRGRQNKVDRAAIAALAREMIGREARGAVQDPGGLVPFGWAFFRDKYRAQLTDPATRTSALGSAALRLGLLGLTQLTWGLDELLTPGWRRVELQGPIFILGHQRSGTTLLHRLLASDRNNIRGLTLQEMILPATSVQTLVQTIPNLPGGPALARAFHRLEERLLSPMDPIHRIRFGEIEEDEFVLWAVFLSAMAANDSPGSGSAGDRELIRHFDLWPPQLQAQALAWYRACLKKKVWREPGESGSGLWPVSKNPAFTQKIPALLRVFPEARFIYLVRNPLEAIPSRLSLIREIWRQRRPGFREMRPEQVETILADSLRTYLRAEEELPGLPPDRSLTITYPSLTRDPAAALREIYSRFSLPRAHPDQELLLARVRSRGASEHRYGPEEFGLDQDRIRAELAQVFEKYGF